VILFYLAENQFNMVGRAPTLNWVLYNAEISGRRVTCTYDERTAARPIRKIGATTAINCRDRMPRRSSSRQPSCGAGAQILQYVLDGDRRPQSARTEARHGRAARLRVDGTLADGAVIHAALVEAGKAHGLTLVGGRCYSSNTLESGWIPSPLPAVYTGEKMKPYREWLTVNHYEAKASIGGSFVSDKVGTTTSRPGKLGMDSSSNSTMTSSAARLWKRWQRVRTARRSRSPSTMCP